MDLSTICALFIDVCMTQHANGKSEEPEPVEQVCEEDAAPPQDCDEANCVDETNCEPAVDTCSVTIDAGASSSTACNGSVDSGLGTGCRSSFASGDRLQLKTLTSSDKLSSLTCVGSVCTPVDEQQSPMSSTSSFLLPTPTTEDMCDQWSLMSDNKSEGGETATGQAAVLSS